MFINNVVNCLADEILAHLDYSQEETSSTLQMNFKQLASPPNVYVDSVTANRGIRSFQRLTSWPGTVHLPFV